MVPFRVFDRDQKQLWIVLNFHPNQTGSGNYMIAKDDDSDGDGELKLISAEDLAKFRFVDFLNLDEES